jgi:hypothetical protein
VPVDQPLALKLERSLAFPVPVESNPGTAAWTEQEVGALLLLLLAGTAAGIFFRLREPNATG